MTGKFSATMRILGVPALVSLLAVLPGVARTLQEPDEPTVVLNTEVVLVNVVAMRKDGFATGLAKSDFVVTENGVPQTIDFFGAETTPFAVTILLDTSGSMEFKFRLARVAAARFMDRVRPTDRVAVFLFGSDVRRVQDFTPGGRDLDDSVWDASAKGITKMYDAVTEASRQLAGRPEQRRAILLLSDGADYGSADSYDEAVHAAQAAGVTIFGIDLAPLDQSGSVSRGDELRARGVLTGFSDKTGGRFFATKSNGTGLNEAFEQIVDELGHQYTLGYSPTNLKHDGTWRAISVTTAQPGLRLRARSGYRAPAQ